MKKAIFLCPMAILTLFSCQKDLIQDATVTADSKMELNKSKNIELRSHSITPNFLDVKSDFKNLEVYPILSSEDILPDSPAFVYGSMADGCGLIKNEDGTFTLINNIEADYSISRITLDNTFKPIHGEYILNAEATAYTAQCSGSLVTVEDHGFGPTYLSGGEWGGASKGVFMTDPYRDANNASSANLLPALGQWSVENAVVMNKNAFPGKTLVLIGDDTSDDNIPSGQLAMYVSNTVGDLDNGNLYGLKVVSQGISYEMDMKEGMTYDIVFEQYTGPRTLNELEQESRSKGIMGFSRVEDVDWRRGSAENNREIYFAVTGRKKNGLLGKGSFYGRIYKVVLDENNPLKGTISCILDGDKEDGKAKMFHSPDNVVATKNYLYIQEDPNGYFDGPNRQHFAQLYQYDLNSGKLETVLECNQNLAASMGYGSTSNSWEITGMIDISNEIDINRTFLLITQNHGWENPAFTDPTAATPGTTSNEGSMLYVIKGLKN